MGRNQKAHDVCCLGLPKVLKPLSHGPQSTEELKWLNNRCCLGVLKVGRTHKGSITIKESRIDCCLKIDLGATGAFEHGEQFIALQQHQPKLCC